MANSHLASTRKRGPQPSNLSVRLFLLDPENKITKVTKQTCSKESIQKLKQKGYGPPPPEHCTSDDKVEFPIALTNEQFKEKLVKIYPNLENSCFVLMKADKNNQLEELNPRTCCFRCYTPENVYHSERGQGRLYIQKIAESEISKCTHGVSLSKRLCPVPGYNQQPFIPIQPKQSSPAVSTFTGVYTSTNLNIIQSVALPCNNVFSAISRPVTLVLASALPAQGLSSTTLNHTSGNTMPQEPTTTVNSTVNMAAHSHLSSTVVLQATPSPQVQNSVHVRQENPSLLSSVPSPTENGPQSDEMLGTLSWPPTGTWTTPRTPNPISTENTVTFDQTSTPAVLMTSQNLLPLTTTASQAESNPIRPSADYMVMDESPLHTPSNVVSQTVSRPAVQYPVNTASQNLSSSLTHLAARNTATPELTSFADMVTQNQQQAATTNVSQTVSRSGAEDINRQPQSQLPTFFSASTASVCSGVNAQFPSIPTSITLNASTPTFQGMFNMPIQSQLPSSSNGAVARQGQFPRNASPRLPQINALLDQSSSSIPFINNTEQDLTQMGASFEICRQRLIDRSLNTSLLQAARTGFRAPNAISGLHDPIMVSSSSMTSLPNPPACSLFSYRWVQSPGLAALADAAIDTEQREQREEYVTSDANIPNVQEIQDLATQNESSIDSFLEHVESTGKLEMSLALLGNNDLMEKLNASTINIRTVEIELTCKLQLALTKFFLPSCLTALSIKDNKLNFEDIFALIRSLRRLNELQELDLSGTTFTERSSSCFLSVLVSCRNLKKLCLTGNSLTNQDINCLVPAFESMKDLVHLNLSKNNLTETQARDILQKQEGKSMVSLDLSQNALRGNEITVRIFHLQSLEHLDLSHNEIRFFPLPKLAKERDLLPTNIKTISLSSNHMTPEDIGSFSTLLIKSDLLKLNLDYNNVGNSIWSLCPLRIKHLKVLGLASAAICGPAVQGLAFLLSLTEELEELNLSSNNLMLADFQQLRSPLSNLTKLKRLNLSNNPDGILVVLQVLPSLKNLEELRLNTVHLNSDDCTGFLCKELVYLDKLKYLNLSGNLIDVEVMRDTVFLPLMMEELIFSDIIYGKKLFASMAPLQHLRILHFSKMRLRTCDVEALTAMLSSFPLLEDLVLSSLTGELEELNLSSNNLVLADLQQLRLPLANLTQLKRLNLSNDPDEISGGLHEILPSLKNLEELRLSNVHLNGDDSIKFCKSLTFLKGLKYLDLSKNAIGPNGTKALASVFKEFLLLEGLDMSELRIKEDEISFLCKGLVHLKRLKYLNLSGNRMDVEVLYDTVFLPPMIEELIFSDVIHGEKLFASMTPLQHLRILHLSEMRLRPCDVEALAAMLPSFPLLEDLVLSKVVGAECDKIFSAIKSLKNIKKIDLTGIQIRGGNVFAEMLLSLLSLEELVLANTNVTDSEYNAIFSAIKSLTKLRKLDLTGTNIPDVNSFAEMLSSILQLKELVLANIHPTNIHPGVYYKIKCLKTLRKLNLGSPMDITNTDTKKAFLNMLPSLRFLEDIVFPHIYLYGDATTEFFSAVASLKYLKSLDLVPISGDKCITKNLASTLPSLQLLEKLRFTPSNDYCHCCDDDDDDDNDDDDEEHQSEFFRAQVNLRYLQELHLEDRPITQTGVKALSEVLPSLHLLEKLTLSIAEFDDKCERQLFAAIRKLGWLKELKLLVEEGTTLLKGTLAEALPSLQLLEKLKFSGNFVDSENTKLFVAALRSFKYLQELYLEMKLHYRIVTKTLAEVLPSLQLLENLVLKEIFMLDESLNQLFAALGSLKYLKKLKLSKCGIAEDSAESLAEVLPSLQFLESLVLRRFYFPNGSEKQVFVALRSLKYLKKFQLSFCDIAKDSAETLAEVLLSLQLLEELKLTQLDLSNSDQRLFTAVQSLSYLKKLVLCSTKISPAGTRNLTTVLPTLRSLTFIWFPQIQHDENLEFRKRLVEVARGIPGLDFR